MKNEIGPKKSVADFYFFNLFFFFDIFIFLVFCWCSIVRIFFVKSVEDVIDIFLVKSIDKLFNLPWLWSLWITLALSPRTVLTALARQLEKWEYYECELFQQELVW